MIVLIDKDLYYMKQYLESIGKYEIYDNQEYKGPIHAYIYEEYKDQIYESVENNLIDLAHNEHIDIRHGVLMINAKNKTPREVENILSERLYRNIF